MWAGSGLRRKADVLRVFGRAFVLVRVLARVALATRRCTRVAFFEAEAGHRLREVDAERLRLVRLRRAVARARRRADPARIAVRRALRLVEAALLVGAARIADPSVRAVAADRARVVDARGVALPDVPEEPHPAGAAFREHRRVVVERGGRV